MRRAKAIKYHGRAGRPVVHTSKSDRKYIMVRRSGGGVKRLYEGSQYRTDGETRRLKL